MANNSLWTPRERAKLVLSSAFANNIDKLVSAKNRRRVSSPATEHDSLAGGPTDSAIHSDPCSTDLPSGDGDTAHWGNPSDFYVSLFNFSLGIGTVLGFPRLCYKHGGGIFLVPYLTMLFLEGIPLVCLEIIIGQRFQDTFLISTWRRIHPSTVGVGISAVFVSFVTLIYYNIIVAWCMFYFVHSLQSSLPWTGCPEGLEHCTNSSRPSEYYWYKTALGVADDISSMKDVSWNLYLYVVIAWFLVFIYNVKGTKAAAKPGYVILIVAMVLYVALFLLVVHLRDWARGLAILVDVSQVDRLLGLEIWRDAAIQVFFSLGIGFGGIVVFSSYNNVGFKCKTAALWYGVFDTVIGICSCIIVFSFRGFQAYTEKSGCLENLIQSNVSSTAPIDTSACNKSYLSEPIPDAFSLVFITWSDSFTHIPRPPVWSSLSYFLLFLAGFGSMSGMVLIVALFLQETINLKLEFATGLICFVSCLFGLMFVTDSGLYLVNMFNNHSSCSLQWIVLLEVFSVTCIFGRKNFCAMVEDMMGEKLHFVWRICWFVVSPAILATLIVWSLYDMANIQEGYFYSRWQPLKGMQDTLYPPWCHVFIGAMCLLPLLFIFGVFAIHSVKSRQFLLQTCHNSWKRLWYWCRQEEEYELQDFSELQQRYQGEVQISLDRIDANFPELLSFDNVQKPVKNGDARTGSFSGNCVNHHPHSTTRHSSNSDPLTTCQYGGSVTCRI